MGLKEAWKALTKKENGNKPVQSDTTTLHVAESDLFPIVRIPEVQLEDYRKIPLAGIGALGTAFAFLPESARQIVTTRTQQIATKETLFVGVNPKGVLGFLRENQYGTVGNIMQVNEQGKQVIAGRMRFKAINGLPVTETSKITMPLNPTLMVVAVAVMAAEQKLDKIQESVENVLRFLELEKQARQRGNLRKLAEIADDYKVYCEDETFCNSRNQIVQQIQVNALQDIEFYHEKVSSALQKKKWLHIGKDADGLINAVIHEFAEYQLACYLYGYCSFLDIMLRKDFSEISLSRASDKMLEISKKYDALYAECRSQLEKYQLSAVEAKILDGVSAIVTGAGKAIGAIPKVKDGTLDETLIETGKNIGDKKNNAVSDKLELISDFADSRVSSFIENLHSIDSMCRKENSLITDGENLYVLKEIPS